MLLFIISKNNFKNKDLIYTNIITDKIYLDLMYTNIDRSFIFF